MPNGVNQTVSGTPFGSGTINGVQIGGGGAFHYTPPERDLVQGRMRGLMNTQMPYLQQARDAALELSAARGQGTGAYAAGAAQRAAIDAALPIAAQDSDTLTRVGLANAAASQQQAAIEAQLALANRAPDQTIVDNRGVVEAQNAHDLQMQRERLAFEGEQAGLGRGQDFSMLMANQQGNLYGQRMGQDAQRQLGFDNYGFDLGLMGQQFGYNSALASQAQGYAQQNAILANRLGMQRDQFGNQMNLYSNLLTQGMGIPEYMADPEAFLGFIQFTTGYQWDQLFGGRG